MNRKWICLTAALVSCVMILHYTASADSKNSTAKKREKADLGTRDFSNESQYTGDVAFSIPITAANGVNVSLKYNSNNHKSIITDNKFISSGWVGLGWQMNLGCIQGDINNTRDSSDDKYFFVGPEHTSELVCLSGNQFILREYKYWKITRQVSNGSVVGWTIILEDGTTIRYGNYNKSITSFVLDYAPTCATRFYIGWGNQVEANNFSFVGSPSLIPYQWDLSDVEDLNGDHVTVRYQQSNSSIAGTGLQYTVDSYPQDITDRLGRKTQFVLFSSPLLFVESSMVGYGQTKFDSRSLKQILFKDSVGTLISGYEFLYDSANVLYSTSSTNKKLFLKRLSEFDSTQREIKRTDFEYAGVTTPLGPNDNNPGAMTKITLPEGGTVEYSYEKTAVIANRDAALVTNGTLFAAYGASRLASDIFNWCLSGSDFFVVLRDQHLVAYRWAGNNRISPDASFPLGQLLIGVNSAYWIHNDYVVVNQGGSLYVAKRKGDEWSLQVVESSIASADLVMLSCTTDYFVYALNCSFSDPAHNAPISGTVKVATYLQSGHWISQSLGTQSGLASARMVTGGRFFTATNVAYPMWMWNPSSLTWDATTVSAQAAGNDYIIQDLSPNNTRVGRYDGSSWRFTDVDQAFYASGTNFIPGTNFFLIVYQGEYRIAMPSSSGWAATLMTTLLPNFAPDLRTGIAIGPDFVVATRFDNGVWRVGVTKFKNGAWQTGVIVHTVTPSQTPTQFAKCVPFVSGSQIFIDFYEPMSELRELALDERNGVWSAQELCNLNLGWNTGNQNAMKPWIQPGHNFSVCIIDPNLKSGGDGTLLGWKRTYGPNFEQVFDANTAGGYDFRVKTKRVTDGMGNTKTTTFSYGAVSYDDDINTARYNKTTVTPPGNNGRTTTYFYNDLGQDEAENFVNVPYYTYLDGSPYRTAVYNSDGVIVSATDNIWNASFIGAETHSELLVPDETTISGRWQTVPSYQSLHSVLDDGAIFDPSDYMFTETPGDSCIVHVHPPQLQLDQSAYTTVNVEARTHTPGEEGVWSFVLWEFRGSSYYYLGEIWPRPIVSPSSQFQTFTLSVPNTSILDPSKLYVSVEVYNEMIEVGSITCNTQSRTNKGAYLTQLAREVRMIDGVTVQRDYSYCSSNGLVSSLLEVNSDSSQRITQTTYAHQRSSYVAMDTAKHMIAQPYSVTLLRGTDVESKRWTLWGNGDGVWRPREEWIWKGDGTNNDQTAPLDPEGSSEATRNAIFESYDSHGNLLQSRDANNIPTATVFGYRSSLPVATVRNATQTQVVAAVFEDGDRSNWTQPNGTWTIVNGSYKQSDGTTTAPWTTPNLYSGKSVDDGILEADVRFENQGTSRYAGIMKYQDASNYVRFELRKSESKVRIQTMKNGSATIYADAPFSFNEYQTYHLKGEISGTTARLYVDGKSVASLTSANVDISAGTIGLVTFQTVATFDNVRYYPLLAVASMQTYDIVSLGKTLSSDENGVLFRIGYDPFNRKIEEYVRTGQKMSLIAEQRYHYSRSVDGNYSSTRPNAVEMIYYSDSSGSSDFNLNNGWQASGDITFNIPYAGETTVRLGSTGGSWDYIQKPVASGHLIARVDVYPDNSTSGAPHPLAFDGANYRFCIQYDPTQNKFRVQLNRNGAWEYPFYFPFDAQRNRWYTVEIEKTETGEVYAFAYPRGQGRTNATGYMYTTNGYPTNWAPYVVSWSNSDYFYLANHHVGLPERTVTFFDGYGRPIQEQTQNKIVSLVSSATAFDSLGRVWRAYKPYEKDFGGASRHRFDPSYVSNDDAYYNAIDNVEAHTSGYPYRESQYFSDPLARVKTQSYPGTDWMLGSGRETKSDYNVNAGTEVPGYSGTTLNLTRHTDEDNVVTNTFKDKFGQTVASWVDPSGLNLRTTFAYDILGNLLRSVTPRGDTTSYIYSPLGRLVQKTSPDQGTTQYIYDAKGNLRFVKDAAHTGSSVGITPVSGTIPAPYSTSGSFTLGMPGRVTIAAGIVNQYGSDYVTVRVKRNGVTICQVSTSGASGASNAIILPKGGYSWEVQTFGGSSTFTYSVTCATGFEFVYYKYDALNRVIEIGEFESASLSANFTQAKADTTAFPYSSCLVTSSSTYDFPVSDPLASGQRNLTGRVSSTTAYRQGVGVFTTSYSYDELGNIEWVLHRNSVGNYWQLKEEHDLAGRITRKHFLDGASSANNLYTQYTYDQTGRLSKVTTGPTLAKIDSVQEALYTYFAASAKRLQLGTAQGVDYRYNTRDWLKKINDHTLTTALDPGNDGPGGTGLSIVDKFGMVLGYNTLSEIGTAQGAAAKWGGNISWLAYNMSGVPFSGSSLVGNTYSYDNASRITGANFGYKSGSWQSTSAYDDSGYTYDANGNILTAHRYGSNGNPMDNLTYVYTAGKNRLRHLNDAIGSSAFSVDIDQQVADNYTYDDNGSLQKDEQRDIAFVLNDIRNLPVSIWKISTGQELKYYYDTQGQRIRKDASITEYYVNSPSGNAEAVVKGDITQATYNIWGADNLGQIVRSGASWSRFYYLKDHLGTVKMTVNTAGTAIGWDDFYPFGMQMELRSSASSSDPRYKFTSKERDAESGYDYFGARFYDPRMGRWLGVDPAFSEWQSDRIIAEGLSGLSAYQYVRNSPIRRLDTDGFVDKDGNRVFVGVETKGLGHSFVFVQDKAGSNTVYSYGRYDGGSASGRSLGGLNPLGKGVLNKYTGADATAFISDVTSREGGAAFEIKGADGTKVVQYNESLYQSSTTRSERDPVHGKVVDTYIAGENTCVDHTVSSLAAGGAGDAVKSSTLNTKTGTKGVVSPITPTEVKSNLEKRAQNSPDQVQQVR